MHTGDELVFGHCVLLHHKSSFAITHPSVWLASVTVRIADKNPCIFLIRLHYLLQSGQIKRNLLRYSVCDRTNTDVKRMSTCAHHLTIAEECDLSYCRVSKLRPAGEIRPAKPFQLGAKTFCQYWKNNIFTENSLIWQNATYAETMTLRKMSGPRIVPQWLMWPTDKKVAAPDLVHSFIKTMHIKKRKSVLNVGYTKIGWMGAHPAIAWN